MYDEWQIIDVNQLFEEHRWSVIHKLPSINGQNVVNEVVKPLAISLNNNNQNVTNYPSTTIQNNLSSTLTINQSQTNERDDNELINKDSPYLQSNQQTATDSNDYTYYLKTDRAVHWVMEVICYGLSLPISTSEHYETVRDCVQIYCEWIYSLSPNKSQTKLIPFPIRDDPNHYFRRILQHLYNIFVPRISSIYTLHNISNSTELSMTDIISKQAMLCHRVLRTISTIAEDENNLMDGESWDNLLLFLLAINDVLLSHPGEREDVGTHLCERVITVLFEIWIITCKRCFPSPSYWKTFVSLFSTWRHRPQVIDQWSNCCLIFTQRLVQLNNQMTCNNLQQQQEQSLYESLDNIELSQTLPNSSNYSSYIIRLIQEMDYLIVSQSWYRFLMIITNPVDLNSPEIISKTKKFTNFATECVVDPRQHPCLDVLPQNFYKAIKGLANLVDTFLSINNNLNNLDTIDSSTLINSSSNRNLFNYVDGSSLSNLSISSNLNSVSENNKISSLNVVTPPNSRKFQKKHTILGGLHSKTSIQQQSNNNSNDNSQLQSNQFTNQQIHNQQQNVTSSSSTPIPFCTLHSSKPIKYSVYRPKINSILKIFGNWLFNSAILNADSESSNQISNDQDNLTSTASYNSLNNQNLQNDNTNWNRRNSNDRVSIEMSPALLPQAFEAGVAESIGALCRLFSSKQADEEISTIYYAKFFNALKKGLSIKEPVRIQILSSILINGTQLFRLNLNGIDLLIPDFLKAIELFVIEKEQNKFKFPANSIIELRRACIKIMLSLLSYPLHFNELLIKDCLTDEKSCRVFSSLKPELVSLILNAFHSEKDSLNLQMILNAFIILLEDVSTYELEQIFTGDTKQNSKISENKFYQTKDTIPDDSKSLYTVVLSSVCYILTNQKKNDTQVSLAALEVLSQIARIHLNNQNIDECKKATNCICDYIVNQCSKPPPLHSKDMHSTLVAAYQCLAIWFQEHPILLKDDICLNTLIEVIELGISGSKSTNFDNSQFVSNASNISNTNTNSIRSSLNGSFNSNLNQSALNNSKQESNRLSIIYKTFKELKPASIRVRESAEFLLNCLMNQFGCSSSSPCPPECVTGCCDLNELSLLQILNDNTSPSNNQLQSIEDACKNFKYFISENSILIGFVNNPKNQNCYCLIRSPFGKFCWEMHFQLTGDNCNEVHSDYVDVPRPISCLSHIPKNLPVPKNFPNSVERVPLTKIENSIPSLKQVINKYPTTQLQQFNQVLKIVNQQKQSEQNLKHRCISDLKNRHFDCHKPKSPKPTDLDCARLIINHLGLLNLEKNNYGSLNAVQLVNLDLNNPELFNQIINLDNLPLRTCDTAFIFYVRKGRIHPQEILNSVCSFNYVKPAFLEFLSSLGTPINCKHHFGWTGNLFTSWTGNFNEGDSYTYDTHHYTEHGGAIYDGIKMSIYWADVSHEIAFIVPSRGLDEEQLNKNINNQSQTTNASICSQSVNSTTINSSLGSALSASTTYAEDKNLQQLTHPPTKQMNSSQEQRSISSYSDGDTISSTSHNLSENSSQFKNSSINNSTNLNNSDIHRKKSRQNIHANIGCDIKVLIIWLENSEDEFSLPINTLMQTTNTGAEKCKIIKDYVLILIHPLKNGLFSIKVVPLQEKIQNALPLLEGTVISKRLLGLFVRLTTLNIYKRRRLDMDSFQLPHVRRRVEINNISKKYRIQDRDNVEFFKSLF